MERTINRSWLTCVKPLSFPRNNLITTHIHTIIKFPFSYIIMHQILHIFWTRWIVKFLYKLFHKPEIIWEPDPSRSMDFSKPWDFDSWELVFTTSKSSFDPESSLAVCTSSFSNWAISKLSCKVSLLCELPILAFGSKILLIIGSSKLSSIS